MCISLITTVLAAAGPTIWISHGSSTLRFSREAESGRRHDVVFPVGLNRRGSGKLQPLGHLRTGANPADRRFFDPQRSAPWFHRGYPFVRLDRQTGWRGKRPLRPYGIHGPITPTLIWGPVSAGCVRMRPADLRRFFTLSRRYPNAKVIAMHARDRRAEAVLSRKGSAKDCPEATLGVRRLETIGDGAQRVDRVCGDVDHWYAVQLQRGDHLGVVLHHDGNLALELYGIRAISPVSGGRFSLHHTVPLAQYNRGPRYLRIFVPVARRKTTGTVSYSLHLRL